MNRFLLLPLLLIFAMLSCVKDVRSLAPTEMFTLDIRGTEFSKTSFLADNLSIHEVHLLVKSTESFDIDDGKALTVSVNSGGVNSTPSFNASALNSSTTLTLSSKQATFFFFPGQGSTPDGILTINIEGYNQRFAYTIKKNEPAMLNLTASTYEANVNSDITLTSVLSTNGKDKVSKDLKVFFQVGSSDASSIKGYFSPTNFAYTEFDETVKEMVARKTFSTNKIPGKLYVKSWYVRDDTKTVRDCTFVQFTN